MEMIEYAIGPFLCRTRTVRRVFAWVFRSTVAIDRRAQKIPMLSCDKAYPYNFYFRLSTVAEVEILAPVQNQEGQRYQDHFV